MQNAISPKQSEVNQDDNVIWAHDEFSDIWYPLDGSTVDEIEAMNGVDDIAL